MKPAIRVENLSKLYRLGAGRQRAEGSLREAIMDAVAAAGRRLRPWQRRKTAPGSSAVKHDFQNTIWALKDVSFEISPGEVVGVIGRNGAGKSTLLKILSGITEPTSGRVRLRGRVGSLLEIGTGFHPELTGRENIFLSGAVLGMKRLEINRKFDDIVTFSEINKFLDTPVKRYSSGMFTRLAFAVAAHLETEILLVDEVLAVADMAFQKKCLGKMDQVSRSGRTVFLVSHHMPAIMNLSDKVAVMEHGRLSYLGPCQEGVEHYLKGLAATSAGSADLRTHPNRSAGCTPFLTSIRLLTSLGYPSDHYPCGDSLIIELGVEPARPISALEFVVAVDDHYGTRLFTVATFHSPSGPLPVPGPGRVHCHIPQLPLAPGQYRLSVSAIPCRETAPLDEIAHAATLEVTAADFYGNGSFPTASRGPLLVPSLWALQDP